MPLNPGTRLGSYHVTASLGAGGMGEVYRATDVTLGRSVAIKVLPESLALDPERLARFEREARTLASLNHPNIAQVYGFENANGIRALIMELVEGPTLADRIGEGPMAIEEALAIARQIATALEVAHEAGIVHRDLKPANVKVRPDGTVKVLDFGLAKAVEPAGVTSTDAMSPTITSPALMTGAGVLLGTAAYMSPEQARGKAVDKRTDIWAFGAVLYEMVTGRRLFDGETNLDVLAQVVHQEPDLQRVPARLQRLLRRCLEKDPKKRLRDITGVELLLEEPVAVAPPPTRFALAPWIAAGVLAIALGGVTWALWPVPPVAQPAPEFALDAPPNSEFTYLFPGAAVSRDGRLVVFTAQQGGNSVLWLRSIGSVDAREIPGTEGINFPFWSPDGKSVAFASIPPLSERALKRTDLVGGTPQKLCDAPDFEGGDWSRQGVILFSSRGIIQRVNAAGGTCSEVTKADPNSRERHTWPHFLPDGRTFLYVVRHSDPRIEGVYASSLERPEQRTKLLSTDTKALYAPPYERQPGFLLWLRGRTLVAQRFDPDTLRLEGDPITVAGQIRVGGGLQGSNRAAFWVSENGLLMYRTGGDSGRSLKWVGRDGKQLESVVQEERDGELLNSMGLSPDRTTLVVERIVADVSDLWVYTIARRVWRKLTFTPGREGTPRWSPDGRQIVFFSDRDGSIQLYRMDGNGAGQEERLTDGPNPKAVLDWSRDGKYVLYSERIGNQRDLWILPFDGPNGSPGKPIRFLATDANEPIARFSPDGKWIAYASDITGQSEAYIRAFPGGPPGEWPVSNGGAAALAWRADGSELFYRIPNPSGAMTLVATPIRLLRDRPEIGVTQTVFTSAFTADTSIMSDDGQRFLVLVRPGETIGGTSSNPLTVVLNWHARLK